MLKKYLGIGAVLALTVISLTGCTEEKVDHRINKTNTVNTSVKTSSTNTVKSAEVLGKEYANSISQMSIEELTANAEKQIAMPEIGETIAIMHVKDYGDITFKFFKDAAPKAVENFLTHAKDGYYNGLTFHRIIKDFMIQGGDPEGTGRGGESIWGNGFDIEMDSTLLPYRGSLCMAKASMPNSIGSQFFINQTKPGEGNAPYLAAYGYKNLDEVQQKYGGDIFMLGLYAQYTVFGQAVSGVELLDKIISVETDSNDKPLKDVVITSIEVTEYNGK